MRFLALFLLLTTALLNAQTPSQWTPLFDGHSLTGWTEAPFSKHGATTVEQMPDLLRGGETKLSPEVLKACDAVTKEILYPMG